MGNCTEIDKCFMMFRINVFSQTVIASATSKNHAALFCFLFVFCFREVNLKNLPENCSFVPKLAKE